MIQLTVQVKRETNEANIRAKKRSRLDGDGLGRTSDAWGYV